MEQKSTAEEFLKQYSIQQNGEDCKNNHESISNEAIPHVKADDDYLNSFADDIDQPLHKLEFPFLFSAIVKKSDFIERASSFCVESLMELEETIIDLYRPYVFVITQHNVEQFDYQHNEQVQKIFAMNHSHIAVVQIEEHCLFFPIDRRASFSEITLQAAKRLPGHLFMLDVKSCPLFYHFFGHQYDREDRLELLQQIDRFARISGQYDEIKSELSHYIQALVSN